MTTCDHHHGGGQCKIADQMQHGLCCHDSEVRRYSCTSVFFMPWGASDMM